MWDNTKAYTCIKHDISSHLFGCDLFVIFLVVLLLNVNFVDDDIVWQCQRLDGPGSERHFHI